MIEVIAIFGPTAVGKTEVAIELAQLLRERGESPVAVSADAIQVYKGLDILTGKATPEQQKLLEHRMLSYVPVSQSYNAYHYAQRAHREVDDLLAEGGRPIVVGGTGLYMRAALADMRMKPAERGVDSELWSNQTRRLTKIFGLELERKVLYQRIGDRIDRMLNSGVEQEVKGALAAGASRTARKAIGFEGLASGVSTEEVARQMKQSTRQYAKRQLTWMRKIPQIEIFDVSNMSTVDTAGHLLNSLD